MQVRTHVVRNDESSMLLSAVMHGRMRPDEADKAASDLGIVLQTTPDDDPMCEQTWSLQMTIAWIIWRSPEAVQSAWLGFRSKCLQWRQNGREIPVNGLDAADWEALLPLGRTLVSVDKNALPSESRPADTSWAKHDEELDDNDLNLDISLDLDEGDPAPLPTPTFVHTAPAHGWQLVQLGPISQSGLDEEWRSGKWPGPENRSLATEAARKQLWAGLLAGNLIASAVDLRSDEVRDIPANEWPFLECSDCGAESQAILRFRGGEERYRHAQLRSSDVVGCWPAPAIQGSLQSQQENTLPQRPEVASIRQRRKTKVDLAWHLLKEAYGADGPPPGTSMDAMQVKMGKILEREGDIDPVPSAKTVRAARKWFGQKSKFTST